MRTIGKDSVTAYSVAASAVLTTAFSGSKVFTDKNSGILNVKHMHATYSFLSNGAPNPDDKRVYANGRSVHSFYYI